MGERVQYPQAGCICEFLEGNAVQIAMVISVSQERIRLLLPNRRESILTKNRLLPWLGPLCSPNLSREEIVRILEEHKAVRQAKANSLNVLDVWELVQGEVEQANVEWLCELVESEVDCDLLSSYGRALLSCKTHFRFQPPFFQIYSLEQTEKRLQEQKKRGEREALVSGGRIFLQLLWDVFMGKRMLPESGSPEYPAPSLQERLETLLRARMCRPEEDDLLWKELARSIPEVPFVEASLLNAWGKIPPHYDVWLSQTEHETGDGWWQNVSSELEAYMERMRKDMGALPVRDDPFISIDSAKTRDIDDAFVCKKEEHGFALSLALAGHSYYWPFSSRLDDLVMKRASSLYLPEKNSHMLPEALGVDFSSLWAGEEKLAFVLDLHIDESGKVSLETPSFCRVRIRANLHYDECEAVLEGKENLRANEYISSLTAAFEMAELRKAYRIQQGAVLMESPEISIHLEGEGSDVRVFLEEEPYAPKAQLLVSECMIAAGAALADYAFERDIPLIYRTQAVDLPREYAGDWSDPIDVQRVIRALVPSLFETNPAPHAALGLSRYALCTSPLRRYVDLVNVAQIAGYVRGGTPQFSHDDLDCLLQRFLPFLEGVSHVQRARPRYWKLLYFKQQGSQKWWDGIISDENENYFSVHLPHEAITLRAKRRLFDDRAAIGKRVRVRIGKVQPLWNDIMILEAETAE